MAEASEKTGHLGWLGKCAGRNVSERGAILEKDDAQADRLATVGKAVMAGEVSDACAQLLGRGSGDGMYIRETHATREAPWRGVGNQPEAREGQAGRDGVAERPVVCAGQRPDQVG